MWPLALHTKQMLLVSYSQSCSLYKFMMCTFLSHRRGKVVRTSLVREYLVSGNLLIPHIRSNNENACSGGSLDQGLHVHCKEEMLHDVLVVQFHERGPRLEESMRW